MKKTRLKFLTGAVLMIALILMSGCEGLSEVSALLANDAEVVQLEDVPEYDDEPFVAINNNEPEFPIEEVDTESFEEYSPLDAEGRCGTAVANIGEDIMPTEKRGSISSVKPSGWQIAKYDNVDGKYLYNRCHLLGYQLTGENANERNLITGTRYMNVDGMLPFENLVADYVKETGNHVLYRVTPIYKGRDLIAKGVQMEGYSVEDQGNGVCFNVFVYNVQPGIEIDYSNGSSCRKKNSGQHQQNQNYDKQNFKGEIRGNVNSHIYHCPGQRAYEDMGHSKNLIVFESEEDAQAAGYRKAKQ